MKQEVIATTVKLAGGVIKIRTGLNFPSFFATSDFPNILHIKYGIREKRLFQKCITDSLTV